MNAENETIRIFITANQWIDVLVKNIETETDCIEYWFMKEPYCQTWIGNYPHEHEIELWQADSIFLNSDGIKSIYNQNRSLLLWEHAN